MELHGRRKIFTNVRAITRKNILDVLNKALSVHNRNRAEEVYLEKYVRGVQPILARQKVYNTAINNKLCVNMANQIVTFKTAEFAGKPITFVSRGVKKSAPKKIEKLNSMMLSEGKPSKDMKLAYWMFTCGVGYRLILNDKAYAVANGELLDEAPFRMRVITKSRENRQWSEISAAEMREFQTMCNPEIELRKYLSESEAKMKVGAPVLVKYGPLKGLSGKLVRSNKKYYLLKDVPGISVMLKVSRWCCKALESS